RYSTETPGGATVDFGEVDLNDLLQSMMGGQGRGTRAARGGRSGPSPFGRQPVQDDSPGEDIIYPVTISFEQSIKGTNVDVRLNSSDRAIDETLSIRVPAGVEDGKKIAARGKGNPGPSGRRGDLLIHVHVTPHDYFRREGDDILLDLPISAAEAASGATVSVPTVDGPVELRIPPGISSGKRLRIKDRGVALREGGRGSQFCRIVIQIPADLSEEEKQQLTAMEKAHAFNPRKDVKW
ncbi:MAG TPA: J domain-containing protein, partial [Phycisphaerae bacterium]